MTGVARLRSSGAIWIPAAVVVIAVLGPYGWMVITSLRTNEELVRLPIAYLPTHPTLENYATLANSTPFASYFVHSLIVAILTTLIGVLLALLAAYGFVRFRFKGQQILLLSTVMVYLVPAIVLVVPLFIVMLSLGLVNTLEALIFSHLTFALPFSIWMLSGYLRELPRDLDEAAMVDGANRIQIFLRIIVPLALPGVVATGLFSFIVSWNDFVYAVMLATTDEVRTLPVGLQLFLSPERSTSWGILSAGGVVTSLPVAILFFFFQRYLIGGLTAGAVK